MTNRLISAIILMSAAILTTMAQDNIPIIGYCDENGEIMYLPESAAPEAYVDFVVRTTDAYYEVDEVTALKVVVDGSGTVSEAIPCEKINNLGQYGFTMPAACTRVEVTATFKKKQFTVAIADDIENGSIEVVGEGTVEGKEYVQLKATPDDDYLFDSVTVTREATGAKVSVQTVSTEGNVEYLRFLMPPDNVIVSATFKPVPRYAVNIIETSLGSITSDLATARVGDKVTLTVHNDPGCMLTEINVVAGYPVTTGGGGAHAPATRSAGDDLWYQQQRISVDKVDDFTYEFTLPEEFIDLLSPNYQDDTEFRVTSSFKCVSPTVMWCADSKTLYFAYDENPTQEIKAGDSWNNETISKIWSGNIVANTAWASPGWSADNELKSGVQRVVFDQSFAALRPTSCYKWFQLYSKLTDIEGIENLNTSKVTNMNSMFFACTSLSVIDVNSFDMRKVTNVTGMFRACSELTTIYCDSTWNVATSGDMFQGDTKLVGAVSYDSGKPDGTMANPITGYFTSSQPIASVLNGLGSTDIPERAFPGKEVAFIVTPNPFGSVGSVTIVGDSSGDAIEYTINGDTNYAFTMPNEPVTVTITIDTPDIVVAALWCEDNTTLYFVNLPVETLLAGSWDGHTITNTWSGDAVINVGWGVPQWKTVKEDVTRVVFDNSFSSVRPLSCYAWFFQFRSLATIEGLEYLNTSEVTNTNSMFLSCPSLTTLDLNSFDMRKVTNASTMFRACTELTTIYCDSVWDIRTTTGMFLQCTKLVGAVSYSSSATDGTMANPDTGYFTRKKYHINVPECEHGTVEFDKQEAASGDTVTMTIIPDDGYTIDKWTLYYYAKPAANSRRKDEGTKTVIPTTLVGPGQHSFKMPAAEVNLDITFKEGIWTGIDNVESDSRNSVVRYYDLHGRYIGTSLDNAEKGIYITGDGRKILK